MVPDASLPLTSEFQPMLFVRWVRVSSGHGSEYVDVLKSDLLPAVKKARYKSYSVWQAMLGTELPQYLLVEGLDNWAFFDGPNPLIGAMGQDAYQRYLSKTRQVTVDAREDVYRFRPELSYLPSPPRK
jgi:hypothetical protein